ncbi:LysE family transporter [Paraburkholderia sp. CNPSo 3076]|uniref:LysE family translocator n=1 Tax=Paraburkholderia sp. CNPSo 3076 TaxID=2940936 RepID=UPI00225C2D3B|nr:LysE family transporter [Paraburkholderia sp. CNPSo 3076]MCX5545561.1 LysE family transporter [Paraburkholderia sp. CNPSo 3076]
MAFHTWLIFLLTSVGMSLSPGPNGLLAMTHGAMYGTRKTLFTIAGALLGFAAVIALCMFGIGALVRASVLWLTVIKLIGGAYLIWLGVRVWRSPPTTVEMSEVPAVASGWSLFRLGLLSSATNPKGLLFFSALLPQFIDPQRNLVSQYAAVALTFMATEFITEYALASAANRIRPWLGRVGRPFNRVCGSLFVAIGTMLPMHF